MNTAGNEQRPGLGTRGAANTNSAAATNNTPTITGVVQVDLSDCTSLGPIDEVRRRLYFGLLMAPKGAQLRLVVGQVRPCEFFLDGVDLDHLAGVEVVGEAQQVRDWIRLLRNEPPATSPWDSHYRDPLAPWVSA